MSSTHYYIVKSYRSMQYIFYIALLFSKLFSDCKRVFARFKFCCAILSKLSKSVA